MHLTNLLNLGGEIMLVIPLAIADLLRLNAFARGSLDVDEGRLVVTPNFTPRCKLVDLLAA